MDGRYCRTSDHADWLILLHVTLQICVSLFSIEIEQVEFDQEFVELFHAQASLFGLVTNKLILNDSCEMTHKL